MEWESIVERQIREAIEAGEFDHLPGKGQPLDLSVGPFEHPLAPTFRRILRDHNATHPLLEARRAIEEELEAARAEFLRSGDEPRFILRVDALNREIRLFNLRAPLENFHLRVIAKDSEIAGLRLKMGCK